VSGRRRIAIRVGLALAVVACCGGLAFELVAIAADVSGAHDPHEAAFVGSDACRACHRDRYRSWHRTFHRTMTREASEETVLGAFDGTELAYGGVRARMDRARTGAFRITFSAAGRPAREVLVDRTVGSHRYQQYLAREGDVWVRLPIAWHVEEQRFFHMNGAFLTPDPDEPPPGSAIAEVDYDRHVTRWNDNCVFCHNVGPRPGLSGERFDTSVAELGIACEACHGPGSAHVAARGDPLRSFALSAVDDDPTMVSPEDLSKERSAEICGRCHGQRLARDVGPFLRDGDPFVPGDDLSDYTEPLRRETALGGDPDAFAPRFWADGTPRLTAYEYQGLSMSRCFSEGELTCTSCHGMHEGDPAGQIRPEAVGDGACVDCHEALSSNEALGAHAHHDPRGEGARCVGCHMPRVVYGLVGARISHHIEVPEPGREGGFGRPDACTLCHVDADRAWAVRARAELWGERGPEDAAALPGAMPEVVRAVFGGDPIERAVAAEALGRDGAPASDETRAARLGALLDVLASDPYPAVRRIAWRSARALAPARGRAALEAYEATASRAERAAVLAEVARMMPEGAVVAPDAAVVVELRARASEVAIEIGE
jgi:hypothetical protein